MVYFGPQIMCEMDITCLKGHNLTGLTCTGGANYENRSHLQQNDWRHARDCAFRRYAAKTNYELTHWKWPTSWLSRICVVCLFYFFYQHARNGASRPWQDVGWNTGCCLTTSLLLCPWRKQQGLAPPHSAKQQGLHIGSVWLQCCCVLLQQEGLHIGSLLLQQVCNNTLLQLVATSCCSLLQQHGHYIAGCSKLLQQCCCSKLLLWPWRKQQCLQVVSTLLQQVVAASRCFYPDESK